MPSVRSTLQFLAVLAPAFVSALPAGLVIRQEASSTSSATAVPTGAAPPPPAGGGLSDVDILQFALTAEHLESAFYQQGFAKFQDTDFMALGLTAGQIKSLKGVGATEAVHVSTLLSAISGAGIKPVEPCEYNFDAALADAKTMVATARVLEAVGVTAYLGAAPLISSSDILAAAASIATVEARHQAFIRSASGAEAVPAPFDVALGPKAVFTMAAAFIRSCPEGSNLNIQPNPAIALQNPEQAQIGQNLRLTDANSPTDAQFCAFVASGGTQFQPITDGNCVIPQNLSGEVYMMITKSKSIADAEVLAGPSVIQPS